MMTRKDYVAISSVLSEYKEALSEFEFDNIVNDFADLMAEDNERFMRDRFIEACNA